MSNKSAIKLLEDAIEKGDSNTLAKLITEKFDPNQKYENGSYPMLHAIKKGNIQAVQLLQNAGAIILETQLYLNSKLFF